MMKCEPQREHRWLQRLVGEWTSQSECDTGPGQPPGVSKGTETVRALGEVWILCEGQAEMPGGGAGTMLMTLGYDPERKRFVGTWVGSMMTHLWVYDGELDASGEVLTLSTEGPNMGPGGGTAKYRDVITLRGEERSMSSYMLGPDGKWAKIMTARYQRRK
jgi:hypothetical protein